MGVLSRTIRLKVEVQYWCARAYSFIADSADKARRKVAESLALLAQILLQHGKASLAAKAASRAISLEGRNPKWHVLFAKAQEKLGNILEAIEAVERAIALDESHPEWHASLASLLRKADRLGEAVAAANRAIAIDSTKLECRMLLSQLNEDLEKHPLGRLEKAFARALTASSALSWEVGESVCSGSDGSFRTGHYGVCAPLELVQNRGSGFRALLSMLPIDRGGTVLDIGAGGVGGWQTTDHLVEFFVGRIIGFQPDENRCAKLRAKYAGRVEMINSFYGYGPKKSRRQPVGARGLGAPFDLIVLDTRPQDLLWEKLLPFAAKDGLRPGGYAICTVLMDVREEYYAGSRSLFDPAEQREDENFAIRYFGTHQLSAAVICDRFNEDPDYRFVTVIDRWVGGKPLAYVVLQRKPAVANNREGLQIPLDLTNVGSSGLRVVMQMLGLDRHHVVIHLGTGDHFGDIAGDLAASTCAQVRMAGDEIGAFDVMVSAVRGYEVPATFERLLYLAPRAGLRRGGYVIVGIVHDLAAAYDAPTAYFPAEDRLQQSQFMLRVFGSERLDAALLSAKFATNAELEFVGLVDRWLDTGHRGLGWLIVKFREHTLNA